LKHPEVTAPLALWFALVFPSLYVTQKFLGWGATAGYAVLAAVVVTWWLRSARSFPATSRATLWWALATIVVVTTAFLIIYPRVNSHLPGVGSDDDDAYNVGARALVAGRSPYLERTYLGNALHQLPGSFILAAPFVWLGTSALQNLFWLPLFFLAVAVEIGDGRAALRLAWLVLVVSPTVMHQVVTGTGHAANTIYVVLGLWWLLRTRHHNVAAVAWGVALASRANFLLLVPLAFGWLRQNRGLNVAVRAIVLTSLTVAILSLPFYMHDPDNFGPLEAADRLTRFDSFIPYVGETIVLAMAVVAVVLSTLPMQTETVFRNCAIVQAIAPISVTVLRTLQRGRLDLSYTMYGTFFSWLALMALAGTTMYQYGHRTNVSG
jgi:hypothetical protein